MFTTSRGPVGPVVDLGKLPGAGLALQCQTAAAVPSLLSDGVMLDVVQGIDLVLRWAAAVRIRMLAEFADRHPPGSSAAPPGGCAASPVERWLPDEVGMTLRIARLEALAEIARARRFVHVLPETLALLETGRIDERRADAIATATAVLSDEKAREVQARVLERAPEATLKQLRDRVRRAVARVDPDGLHRRHREAVRERMVSVRSLEEGMASLWFYGPAEQIEAAWVMADRLARAPRDPADERTLDQRRFDLAVQVLQGRLTVTDMRDVEQAVDAALGAAVGTAAPHDGTSVDAYGNETEPDNSAAAHTGADADTGPKPTGGARIDRASLIEVVAQVLATRPSMHTTVHKPLVQVVVGLDTLLGADRPAELLGHGPIDALTARALAAGGVWTRLVTDPLSGRLLDHGRTRYTPPPDLADFVRARDQICRGPGCTRRIAQLDHHIPFGGGHDGATSEANLDGYCIHCHQLEDAPGWSVIAGPDHSLTWISPNGHRTVTAPYDYRAFTDPAPDARTATADEDRPTVGATAGIVADRAAAGDDAPPF